MTSGSGSRQRDSHRRAPAPDEPAGDPAEGSQATPPDTATESAAAVISRALGADRARRPAPRRGRAAAALAALLLLAGAGGYIAGAPDSPPPGGRAVEAGATRLSLPQGWERRPPRRGIESVAARPIVAAPPGGADRRIVAAELPREGLGLVPPPAAARLEGISAGEAVRLGRLRATRYRAVESAAPRRRVTLFASPTTGGVAMVACAGPRSGATRFMRRCQQVAATLSLAGGQVARGPSPGHVSEVERTIARLDAGRAAAGRRLGRARSRAERVGVVRALTAAHAGAADTLERLPDESAAGRASAPVVSSLRAVERAYRTLGGALRGGSRRREQAAREEVRRRDALLRRSVARL